MVATAARIATVTLALFAGGCEHLSLFEDKPTAQSTPSRKPASHKTQDRKVAALPPQTTPANDPQRAARLRAQALEQMNRGAIDDAVGNLKLASELDPTNTLIRRDLDRALRIQTTVQNKS